MEKTTTENLEIKYVTGDATKPEGKGVKIIVHCNNAQGAWGAGFVLALSKRWRAPERQYVASIRNGSLKLGEVQLVKVEKDIIVANLVGQNLYPSGPDRIPLIYAALEKGLEQLAGLITKEDTTVHMPRIGAGLAGGSWERIEKIIIQTLVTKGFNVTVYDLPINYNSPGKSLHFKK
jgi:O-acetyl-ADP-ribose deacetylase (regulator of RNase III)